MLKKQYEEWCEVTEKSKLKPVITFAKILKVNAYSILNHCFHPLHTSSLEKINNKIKVIERKAYRYYDTEFSALIIKNPF